MIDKTLARFVTERDLTGISAGLADGDCISTGHRLSIVEQNTDDQPLIKKGIIIPRKGMIELRRLLDDGESTGQLGFKDNSAIFEKDGLTLTMQLIEGEFPDYKQVIPQSCTKKVIVNRELFQSALKRTSLLSPDKAQGVRLDLSNGNLALAHNPDVGEAKEDIEIS